MPKPVTIADQHFRSMGDAIARCREILYGDEPGTEIAGPDAEIVEALFCARPDKLLNLQGHDVLRYLRNWQPKEPRENDWTLCFWAELDDGTLIDFSFMKAVKMLADGEVTGGA